MKRVLIIIQAVVLLAAGGYFCRYMLTLDQAKWLQVETSSYATARQPFNVRVNLESAEPGKYLRIDLHWMDSNNKLHNCLCSARPVKISSDNSVHDVSFNIPAGKDVAFIFPVIYISHDGSWMERIVSARAEYVPVISDKRFLNETVMTSRCVFDYNRSIPVSYPESAPLRMIIAGIWILIAVIIYKHYPPLRKNWLCIAAIVTGIWEVLGISIFGGKVLRYLAYHIELYGQRRDPQQILTVAVIMVSVLLLLYLVSFMRETVKIVQMIALFAFWGVSMLKMFSLHEIDELLSGIIAGIQAGQMIKLSAALVCLAATVFMIVKDSSGLEKKIKPEKLPRHCNTRNME